VAKTEPHISVVVPTRDRPAALSECLAALAAQTVLDRLEVIVVDDGSSRIDAVAAVVARHPSVTLVRARGHGAAAARNEGARTARGGILCFTDDDCVPSPGWVQSLAAALDGGADAVGGTTVGAGGALAEAFELIAHAPARTPPAGGSDLSFAPSNNLACRKVAFAEVPFDEAYAEAAGEDRDWCLRLIEAGYTLRRAPHARLQHRQRVTPISFLHKQVRYGEAAYRFRRFSRGSPRLEPASFYFGLLRDAFGRGFVVGLLVAAAQVATAVGFIRGWVQLRGGNPALLAGPRPAPAPRQQMTRDSEG
jgi:GT2 family glycosyltransferase